MNFILYNLRFHDPNNTLFTEVVFSLKDLQVNPWCHRSKERAFKRLMQPNKGGGCLC